MLDMHLRAIPCITILILLKFSQGSGSGQPGYPRYLPGGAACSGEHVMEAVKGEAPCKPRDKVIPVPWPNNTDIHQLRPSHVVVRRCSGGCHGSSACRALNTRVRQVSVMMGKCPVAGGKCDKECASLEVEDEVECECGCARHLEEECEVKRESHVWSKESCGCECRDQEARRQCLESPGRIWSSSSCSCLCNSITSCPTGLTQDPITCTCQPGIASQQIADTGVAGPREDRDTAHLLPPWLDTVLIIGLASLTVLLSIVCVALLRRIHNLKTQLRNTRTSHVSVAPNLYSPCPVSVQQSHHLPDRDRVVSTENIIKSVSQHSAHPRVNDKMYSLYSSDSSEVSSERQTDLSYYTDTSLTPPPCTCSHSECSTLLGRETNV